jgi:cell division protein FtsI/penicillin-binding protein 2
MKGKHGRLPFTEKRDQFFRAAIHRRRRWPTVLAAMVLAVALVAGAVVWQVHHSAQARSRAELERTVSGYLAAWAHEDWTAMEHLLSTAPAPKDFARVNQQMFAALHVGTARFVAGEITEHGSSAIVPYTAQLELTGLGPWSYRGTLEMTKAGERWQVRWNPATVHPSLSGGMKFGRTRTWPDRAPILAHDGDRLTIQGDVVTVGVVPSHIKSRKEVYDAFERYTGVDRDQVKRVLDAPGSKPDWFLPVVTLRLQRYLDVRSKLYPVPGIFFHRGRGRILLREGFAQQVVGRVGEITAEELKDLGDPYEAGDVVGQYGLEQAFERQLAGSPAGTVELRRGDKVVQTLARFPGRDPSPVQTTLDVDVQRAAEEALDPEGRSVALVAVDTGSGEIRAVANRPVSGADTGLDGHYPPGSTFKVVTGAALLAHGTRMDSPASCPPTINAGGKVFRNFEGEALGSTTFSQAFAHSCNTAFIGLALRLPNAALPDMAATFGFDTKYSLPLPPAATQFPRPVDDAERAAAAIGQGRVLATPLHMATVAAAAASGVWRAPRLLTTDPAGPSHRLPKGVSSNLRSLMRLVVTEGTGTAADVPGKDVAGKTGTAEFGTSGQTHAWFIGFRGHLAFAVLVPAGGVGGQEAAPIAARFVRAL